jgi:hypothetical protein
MLGRDVYAKITEPYTDAVMKDGKEVGRVLRDGLTTVEKGKLMSELSVGLREKEKQLMEAEDRLMNKRMEIQTKLMQGSMGMPKLIVDEAKKKAKVLDIEEQIFAIEEVRRQRASSNTTIDKAADDNEITKIANLNARLDVAKRLTNEMLVLKDGVVNAFSSSMQNAIQGLITGTMKLKDAFKSMLKSVLQMMAQLLAKMAALRILNSMGFAIPMADGGVIPMAKGGITGYRNGGIATEPTYLVGEGKHNEAVVPLPDGRSIPVNMKGGGNNNIVVNVDANGGSSSTGMSGEHGKAMGKAIAVSVMETIQREKRPGGLLS